MVNSKIQIISEKTVFECPYFSVYEVVAEKERKKITKVFIARKSVVIVLAITPNNEVYLVKQYRDALKEETLEAVTGQVDEGEDPLTAAKRELSEEAGLTAAHWEELVSFHHGANMSGKIHVFVATDLIEGNAHPEDDENITEVLKMPIQEAIAKTETGEIDISVQIAALQLYKAKRMQNNG